MALNQLLKNKMVENIKCFHSKIKNENCYTFILNDKFTISYNSKGDKGSLVISDEKKFFKVPKNKRTKQIPFRDGIKNVISKATKSKNAMLFPIEGYLFIQEVMTEFSKIKPKEPNPIACNGG